MYTVINCYVQLPTPNPNPTPNPFPNPTLELILTQTYP